MADWVPLSLSMHRSLVVPEQYVLKAGERLEVGRADVGPDYFRTLRIPLLEGRDLRTTDDMEAVPVAVVNRTFRDRFWPGGHAVGRQVQSNGRTFTVVGVAEDSRYYGYDEPPTPFLYLPQLQHFYHEATFHVRVVGAPADLASAVEAAIHRVDPRLPIYHVMPLREQTHAAGTIGRTAAMIAGLFGVLALVLAAFGVYGVIAQATRQRRREIGIRLALGADPGVVLRLLLRRGLGLAAVGLALGLVMALGATGLVQNQLVGVGRFDPLTWAVTIVGLASISFIASYLPIRRAARQDAVLALRSD
jgi:ABC-type lipoprotein release transport system permease subunit